MHRGDVNALADAALEILRVAERAERTLDDKPLVANLGLLVGRVMIASGLTLEDLREAALSAGMQDYTRRQLAKRLGMPRSTLHDALSKIEVGQ